jgi:uncharacterized protein YegP (UPF0339 family)
MKHPDTLIKKRTKNGWYYFVVKSANGKNVMKSDYYQTHGGRWKAIQRYKFNNNSVVEK